VRAPWLLTSLLAVPLAGLQAQDDRCVFRIEYIGRQGTTEETPAGTNYFAGGGVRLFCAGTTIRMESDSVAAFDGGRVTYFIGNVKYRDSTLALDADRGTWLRDAATWEARGNVFSRNLENGSTIAGPSLDYLRPREGLRAEAEMYATGRPRIEYAAADSTGESAEPYVIVADRVRMRGDDRMWGGGSVTIDRSDFSGRSDSLWLDSGARGQGSMIGGSPEVVGSGDNPYRLSGDRIDMELQQSALQRVIARDNAHALNDEWDLTGRNIAVHLWHDAADRIDAWGGQGEARPRARSDLYRVVADSIALDLPEGTLSLLQAYGDSRLDSAPDSLTGEADWISGDTVVASFMPADAAGSEGTTVLDRLVARSDARSFRQIHPAGSPQAPPSLNYVRGNVIVVTMKRPPAEGVDRVDVEGQVEGVQLEPAAGSSGGREGRGS